MHYHLIILLILTVTFIIPAFAQQITVHTQSVTHEGDRIGKLEVKIDEDSLIRERIQSELIVHFDNLPDFIDDFITSKGDLPRSCSKRLYWVGNTHVRNTGRNLDLSSRVRYEQWLCAWLKTWLFRDTKTIDWHLEIQWGRRDSSERILVAQVDNIRNFPNWLEDWLGLRFRKKVSFSIPKRCGKCLCSEIETVADPQLGSVNFSTDSSSRVVMTASVSFLNLPVESIEQCVSRS